MAYTVILEGGTPWGFRLQGGQHGQDNIRIAKLNPNSKAYNQGVKVGDFLDRINGAQTSGLQLNEALQLIRNANHRLELELRRSDRSKKTSVPEIRINGPSTNGHHGASNGHLSDSDYYYSSCDEEGIIRTNAITNYTSSGSGSGGHLSDGDNSGSTSDSQSSVVHVVGPYKGPLADNMKNLSNSSNNPTGQTSNTPGTPKTTVWTPFGQNKVREYKPVSFSVSGSILGGGRSGSSQPQSQPQQQPQQHYQQQLPQQPYQQQPQQPNQQQPQQPNQQQPQQPYQQQQNYQQQSPQQPYQPQQLPQQPYQPQQLPQQPYQPQQLPQQPYQKQSQQQPHQYQPLSINTSSFAAGASSPTKPSFSNTTNGNRGNTADENISHIGGSSPSYSNFNGSGSVIVTASPPGSAYTSITLSSKKAEDQTPTPKFSLFGASTPPPLASGTSSPTKVGPGMASHASSPLSPPTEHKPFVLGNPPKSSLGRPISPSKFSPASLRKSSFGPSSPSKPSLSSPVKSNVGSSGPFPSISSPGSQRQPQSPSKSVTFGPVTSLGESRDSPEQQLSVSQTKNLFEQKQKEHFMPPRPQTAPHSLATASSVPTEPKKPLSSPLSPVFGQPSSTTMGTPTQQQQQQQQQQLRSQALSPTPQQRLSTKTPPLTTPKSPQAKSKGLAMFLSRQEKYHDPEDSMTEFTDTEEPDALRDPRPKSPAIVRPPKQVPNSPIIGRAVPMMAESGGTKEDIYNADDLNHINNNNNTGAPTSSLNNRGPQGPKDLSPKLGSWTDPSPSPASRKLDELLEQAEARRREREVVTAAPLTVRTSPLAWSPDTDKKEYKAVQPDPAKLQPDNNTMNSVSPNVIPEESFAWKPPERATTAVSSSTVTTTTTTATANKLTPSTTSYTSHNGSISHSQEAPPSGLPTYTSPTITLLQKSRELSKGNKDDSLLSTSPTPNNFEVPSDVQLVQVEESQIPQEAVLVGTKESEDGDKKHYDSYYRIPGAQKETKTTRVVEKKKSQYEGIGPTDESTGVPIVPRGSVDKKMHKDWYRRMYQSLHKQDRKEGDPDSSCATSDAEEENSYKPTYVFPDFESESEVEDNPYQPTYDFSDFEEKGSTMSLDRSGGSYGSYGKKSYTLPHARYREEKYKNQPRSIENYEPGFSSIAFKEARVSPVPPSAKDAPKSPEPKPQSPQKGDKKADKSFLYNPPIEKPGQFSKYVYSDSEPDIKKKQRALSPASDIENREAYRRFQKGGDIPYEGLRFPAAPKKERSQSASGHHEPPRDRRSLPVHNRSPSASWDRKRREEEIIRRKQEMQRITADEKRKRIEIERRANEARRHNDFLTEFIKDKLDDKYWLKLAGLDETGGEDKSPSQKSPIALNRYDDAPDIPPLQRPKKKLTNTVRGKARALYNFNSQNTKELSFRKNDIIILLRQIDKNWYEGEHHGRVGIFPVNYVEVVTSLEEARDAAILREGQAKAKHNFTAQSSMELSFKKGDTVSLIRKVDGNWYEGRCGRRQGIFPASYIQVMSEPDTPYSSYAPTPATGSPSQLSPVSTISNGPAPTIPSAPMSPRSSIDNFDFGAPYGFGGPASATSTLSRSGRPSYSDYGSDMILRPSSALGGRSDAYDSLNRYNPSTMHRPNSAVPFTDYYGRSMPRDSAFHSDEARYRKTSRQPDPLSKSMSNSYEARIQQFASQGLDNELSLMLDDEPRYPKYRALYNYKPQNPDELELMEGDVIFVMERCDDDWYVGTSDRTKEFGTFPGNYVKPL